jgi:hypothetical protein
LAGRLPRLVHRGGHPSLATPTAVDNPAQQAG